MSATRKPAPSEVGAREGMRKYRKKVTVEARQWFPDPAFGEFIKKEYVNHKVGYGSEGEEYLVTEVGIRTLEGFMRLTPGDWIITGIRGERYACKADIFAETYELAQSGAPLQPGATQPEHEGVAHELSFSELRTANLSRCSRWHPRGLNEWSLSDWGIATAGEMGEALNIIKKLNRERDGIAGNSLTADQLRGELADEIADVAIYLDILAASEGIDLSAAIVSKFNRTSKKVGFPERLQQLREAVERP